MCSEVVQRLRNALSLSLVAYKFDQAPRWMCKAASAVEFEFPNAAAVAAASCRATEVALNLIAANNYQLEIYDCGTLQLDEFA